MEEMTQKIPIACFVSPHGFGHAARASAVMNGIGRRWPFVHFEIFSNTPQWFFNESLSVSFACHRLLTDIGFVQTTPLEMDLEKTLSALDDFLPFDDARLDALAEKLQQRGCLMVLCDISPLGIAAGRHAGIPTMLIENFTWDWLYEMYGPPESRLVEHIAYLKKVFSSVDHHIQTEPVCESTDNTVRMPPIARKPKTPPEKIRSRLGIGEYEKLVLVTTGGIPNVPPFIDALEKYGEDVRFIVPGAFPELPPDGQERGNVIRMPQASAYYHPDLVYAADAVVGKVGYSTLAEVFCAGKPFGFVARSHFRESEPLVSFILQNMTGMPIDPAEFLSGDWIRRVPDLLSSTVDASPRTNGADRVADYICDTLAKARDIIEIVDTGGCVIGAAPRKRVHGNNRLLHRVVHVLVFDDDNRLLLQKRSEKKRVAPGKWDTSVGGHVDCGETIETACRREAAEELGIAHTPFQFAYQYIHTNDFESELVYTHVCRYAGVIRHNPEEIDAIRYWGMEEIEAHLGKGIFSDNFEDEFARYLRWEAGRKTPGAPI